MKDYRTWCWWNDSAGEIPTFVQMRLINPFLQDETDDYIFSREQLWAIHEGLTDR